MLVDDTFLERQRARDAGLPFKLQSVPYDCLCEILHPLGVAKWWSWRLRKSLGIDATLVAAINWKEVSEEIRSLAPYAQRCYTKTLLNGRSTSTRTQLGTKANCPMCGLEQGDSHSHCATCDGWAAAMAGVGKPVFCAHFEALSILGLLPPSSPQMMMWAAAYHAYHSGLRHSGSDLTHNETQFNELLKEAQKIVDPKAKFKLAADEDMAPPAPSLADGEAARTSDGSIPPVTPGERRGCLAWGTQAIILRTRTGRCPNCKRMVRLSMLCDVFRVCFRCCSFTIEDIDGAQDGGLSQRQAEKRDGGSRNQRTKSVSSVPRLLTGVKGTLLVTLLRVLVTGAPDNEATGAWLPHPGDGQMEFPVTAAATHGIFVWRTVLLFWRMGFEEARTKVEK